MGMMSTIEIESMARVLAKLHEINYDSLPEKTSFWGWLIYGGLSSSKAAYREKAEKVLELSKNKG